MLCGRFHYGSLCVSLQLFVRLGTHLANWPRVAFACPSCQLALPWPCSSCVWPPILPTRLAFPLVAEPWPCRIKKSTSKPKLVLIRPPARPFCLVLPCVVVFVTALRVFGRPSCLLALRCVAFGCPSCQLALPCPWSPNLGHAVLKNLPPSQNWYLSVLRLVFFPSAPLCGRFCYGSSCVWGPILPTCLALRLGAPLAESPCLALGLPTLDRPY